MSEVSQLIQPIISTEALSTLTSIVPGVDVNHGIASDRLLPSRSIGFSRYRQVLRTSVPLMFADLLGIVGCYLIAAITSKVLLGTPNLNGLWNNLLAVCICHLIVGRFLGLFPASGMNPVCELRNQLTSVVSSFVLLVSLNGLLGDVTRNEVLTIGLALPFTFIVAPVSRFCVRRICAPFAWWGEKVIIVGSGQQARHVFRFLERSPQRGLKPLGVVDENANEYWLTAEDESFDFLGTTAELISICRQNDCHWVIAAVADKSEEQVRQILTRGSFIPNLVVLNTSLMMPTMWVDSFDAAGLSGTLIRDRLLFPYQRMMKRFMDVTLSALLLVICSPLLLCIAAWIKCVSPGPVFFRHHGRIGRCAVTFGALKIRTMVINADQILKDHLASCPEAAAEWQRDLKLKNDPRIIPGIGAFLRRTSLDELPQLLNILWGDMSLVGPRPIYTDIEVEKFRDLYPLYLRVRPGLTGLWQVSGRNNTTYEDRVNLDCYYIRNWSLWLDYFILLRTVRTVLLREGSY